MDITQELTVSVIIVTMNRPDVLRRCLECMELQEPQPEQVIVVDGSTDDRTINMMEAYPQIVFRRNEMGFGHMTVSRNIGLMAATGDIIAYIDDDAFAHPGWLKSLKAAYDDPGVGGVGGRALNNIYNEAKKGVDQIGTMQPNGDFLGFFAADPGKILEVDHLLGCNMSFRREALAKLGGFRTDFRGNEMREETDMCLRVRSLGYRLRFTPFAVVDHITAPRAKGHRSDLRAYYYAERNQYLLLIRNFGVAAPIVRRYFASTAVRATRDLIRQIYLGITVAAVRVGGTAEGIVVGILGRMRQGSDPIRKDAEAQEIRRLLEAVATRSNPSAAEGPSAL